MDLDTLKKAEKKHSLYRLPEVVCYTHNTIEYPTNNFKSIVKL